MAASRRSRSQRRSSAQEGASSPSQEDEADVIAEVGAERDEELDELVATEEKVIAIGAVDAESVRENRRLQTVVDKKRGNMKNVPFNASDVLAKFDWIVKYWPPNGLHIKMKRLTGTPVQHTIMTFPRSGVELYAALMDYHGVFEEAKYEVVVTDSTTHEYRGKGQITLPDTQPKQPQGGYPMNAPQYPPQQPAQQQWPPQGASPQQGAPPQGAPPQAQPPPPQGTPPQQPPPPQVHVMPPPPVDPMAMMTQMFDMFTNMRTSLEQQQQPPQQQPPPQMPPPPPAHADPATMMQWMQKMFGMFQQMQPPPQAAPQAPGTQPAQPQANPMAAMMGAMGAPPPMTPPPGTIWLPPFGFVSLERMAQVFGGAPGAGGPHRSPYSGGGGHGPPAPYTPPTPPAPPKSAVEQFQETISVVQTAVDTARQLNALLPQQQVVVATPATTAEDDDSPVQIIDTGPAKLVVDRKDGTLRTWETGWANMKGIMDWVAEQREAIQKGNAEQQEEEEEPKQLPPGYVVVTKGYEPPPGMVAVPVDPNQVPQAQPPQQPPQQAPLPPPPANMPPPLQSTPPPKRTWEAPTMPIDGEG